MLLDVPDDREFQRYLDHVEQRLHVRLAPILAAAIHLQVARNFVQAQDYIKQRGRPLLELFYRRIYRDQFRAVTRQLEEKQLTPFMQEQLTWLQLHAASQITNISQTLTDQVADIVTDMVRQGKGAPAIAREIRKQAVTIGKARAAVIARTETHNAAMAAVEASLKYKNITIRSKTWQAVGDSKVRPSHAAVSGTTVPFDQPFTVGGSLMMRPGDGSLGAGAEEIVNCRCSVLYHTTTAPSARPPAVPPGGTWLNEPL